LERCTQRLIMNIYFYAPTLVEGTRELMTALDAKRLVRYDGMTFRSKGKPVTLAKGDVVVCWGAHVPEIAGIKVINASDKFTTELSINKELVAFPFLVPNSYGVEYSYNPVFCNMQDRTKLYKDKNIGSVYLTKYPGYVTAYIAMDKDYRIFIANGIFVKTQVRTGNKTYKTTFEDIDPLKIYNFTTAAREFTCKFGLDFCAVDVASFRNSYGPVIAVRKVVSAPKLPDAATVQLYKDALLTCIKER